MYQKIFTNVEIKLDTLNEDKFQKNFKQFLIEFKESLYVSKNQSQQMGLWKILASTKHTLKIIMGGGATFNCFANSEEESVRCSVS